MIEKKKYVNKIKYIKILMNLCWSMIRAMLDNLNSSYQVVKTLLEFILKEDSKIKWVTLYIIVSCILVI